jgi:TatD DNase family protein
MLFDTHAHYNDAQFDEDRDEVLSRVREGGVSLVLNAAADMDSVHSCIRLAEDYDFIYTSVGVHPHDAIHISEETIETLRREAEHVKVVAVGEIGLDYYYDNSPRDTQKYWFARQIGLARELGLPVIVHNRDAHEDSLRIVQQEGAKQVGGVFHCFTGSVEMARELLKLEFYISVGGPVTFKNARKLIEVVQYVPMDRILIETDCPYLTPEPHRGKRNESTYVRLVAERIAQIKGCTFEEIASVTLENGKRLFKIS